MKRTLVLMMVSLILLAFGEKSNAVTVKEQSGKVKDFVEVLYFHGKQRCMTCRSIETEYERTAGVYVPKANEGRESGFSRDRHLKEGECPDSGEVRSYLVVVIPCSAQERKGEG